MGSFWVFFRRHKSSLSRNQATEITTNNQKQQTLKDKIAKLTRDNKNLQNDINISTKKIENYEKSLKSHDEDLNKVNNLAKKTSEQLLKIQQQCNSEVAHKKSLERQLETAVCEIRKAEEKHNRLVAWKLFWRFIFLVFGLKILASFQAKIRPKFSFFMRRTKNQTSPTNVNSRISAVKIERRSPSFQRRSQANRTQIQENDRRFRTETQRQRKHERQSARLCGVFTQHDGCFDYWGENLKEK